MIVVLSFRPGGPSAGTGDIMANIAKRILKRTLRFLKVDEAGDGGMTSKEGDAQDKDNERSQCFQRIARVCPLSVCPHLISHLIPTPTNIHRAKLASLPCNVSLKNFDALHSKQRFAILLVSAAQMAEARNEQRHRTSYELAARQPRPLKIKPSFAAI